MEIDRLCLCFAVELIFDKLTGSVYNSVRELVPSSRHRVWHSIVERL